MPKAGIKPRWEYALVHPETKAYYRDDEIGERHKLRFEADTAVLLSPAEGRPVLIITSPRRSVDAEAKELRRVLNVVKAKLVEGVVFA